MDIYQEKMTQTLPVDTLDSYLRVLLVHPSSTTGTGLGRVSKTKRNVLGTSLERVQEWLDTTSTEKVDWGSTVKFHELSFKELIQLQKWFNYNYIQVLYCKNTND